jgi:hypothetical protein
VGVAVAVLDLDDPGAQGRGHGRAVGHGVEVAELDDRDAGERVGRWVAAARGRRARREGPVVDAERGRGPRRGEGTPLEVADGADLAHRSDPGIVDGDDVAVVDDLGVIEALLTRHRHLEGDVGTRHEQREPVVEVLGAEGLEQEVLPRLGVVGVVEHREPAEPRLLDHVTDAGHRAQRPALVGQERGGLDEPPVAGCQQDAVAAGCRGRPGVGRRLLALLDHELGDGGHEVVEGLEAAHQRGVEGLAPPGALAHEQCAEDAGHRLHGGAVAAPGDREHDGAVAVAERAPSPHPRLGRDQRVVALQLGVWAGRPEPRDRAVDQLGVSRPERIRTDAPPPGGAGREALDHDVGAAGEAAQLLLAVACAQVGDQALLAAVPHHEPAGVEGAEPVALGRFHLDDPRPGISEDHPGQRRRDAPRAELQDVQPVTDVSHRPPSASRRSG